MAAWLRELIKANFIPLGEVDERSIEDVRAEDLEGFIQCHFFAGIGGWPYALRLAGWDDRRPVCTGSCPCQPFSQAGKRKVDSDERHLWPAFRTLISKRKFPVVFGEQVASKDGRIWLAGVRADLEAMGYVFGAADLCAAGISAPMVSQRLHWVAEADNERQPKRNPPDLAARSGLNSGANNKAEWMGTPNADGCETRSEGATSTRHGNSADSTGRDSSRLAEADGYHSQWWSGPLQVGWNCFEGEVERGSRKYRAQWRIKPGLSLLADGIPGRVAQLCGFGNAIVPQLAAEFIKAFLETKEIK